jgi:hypothetical protein
MGKEEKLLEYWRELSAEEQDCVLEFTQLLQANRPSQQDCLSVRSRDQLEALLLEGVNSLDRGEGVEATDEWWEQKRQNLIARQKQHGEQ